jgi:hypothetical protein
MLTKVRPMMAAEWMEIVHHKPFMKVVFLQINSTKTPVEFLTGMFRGF